MFALADLLRNRGHEVSFFSMRRPENLPCAESEYFVAEADFFSAPTLEKIRLAGKIIYNFDAKRRISRLLDAIRPDIVHLHNFHHQLSPSILRPIYDRKIPMIMTVHDLKVICPNYLMLSKGEICERCKVRRYHQCFLQGCVKESRVASLINTVEMTLHWLLGSHGLIDRFLTPSDFYRKKLIEWGIPGAKVEWVANFVDPEQFRPVDETGDYFFYAGRISKEKGIFTILNAAERLPDVKFKIAGTGPQEESAEEYARIQGISNVEFLGFVPHEAVIELMSRCRATLLPSEWYENGSISLLESFALARPVIASDIGGNPEAVIDDETGFLHRPGDGEHLAECVEKAWRDPEKLCEMGRNARDLLLRKFSPDQNVEKVLKAYSSVMDRTCL
jgi:glycosyltransferase involved in cell wall biosynthesis